MPKIVPGIIKKKVLSRKIIKELKKTDDKRGKAAKVPGAARKLSGTLELWKLEQMWGFMQTQKAIQNFEPRPGESELQTAARFRRLLK